MKSKRGSFILAKDNSELYFWKNSIISIIVNIYCYIVKILCSNKQKKGVKYQITICAIFKDEAQNFDEWLSYHISLGVDHFYLYNNFSSDNYIEVLSPYIKSGRITLIEWSHNKGQLSAYQHCYDNYNQDSQWLGFIDLDEFVVPNTANNIKDFLEQYKSYSSILIYWKMFGSSGQMEHKKEKLTIEQYEMAWSDNYEVGKLFYNLSFPISKIEVHSGRSSATILGRNVKIYPVNDSKVFVNPYYPSFGAKVNRRIQINHYWSKSYNDYLCKRNKGRATSMVNFITDELFFRFEYLNNIRDYKINRFIIGTKIEMRRNK